MADITSTGKLVKELENATGRLARMKHEAALAARRIAIGGGGAVGASAIGVARAFDFRLLPGTEVDTGLVLGGLLVAAGVTGIADTYSDVVIGAGIGAAAPGLAEIVEAAVRKARA